MRQVRRQSPQTRACRRRRMQSAAFWRGLAIRFMLALFRYMWWGTCWVAQFVWPGVNCGPTSKRNANAAVHKKLLNGFNGSLHNWNDIHRERPAWGWVPIKSIRIGNRNPSVAFGFRTSLSKPQDGSSSPLSAQSDGPVPHRVDRFLFAMILPTAGFLTVRSRVRKY